MATVDDRWYVEVADADGTKRKQPTERRGRGKRWCVRWREPDGRERRQSFDKKADADAHAATVEADKLRGSYIDTRAGRELFGDYAERWLRDQTTDPSTRADMAQRVRLYVQPHAIYRTPIGKVLPSTVQSWLRSLEIAESTKQVVFAHVAAILTAAVDDDLIAKNPARASSVRKPKAAPRKVSPWPHEWVTGMYAELPERYRIVVLLGAGLGLRRGEILALSPDDVDFLRGWVTVQRQLKLLEGRKVFALPKGRKSRSVPLPASVRDALAAYLAAYPPASTTLPWHEPSGKETTVSLAITVASGDAYNQNRFNDNLWRPARDRMGIPNARENGMHALRHYYASVLLDAGESVKAVSEYLGHASAAMTLDVYAHLMPSSEERTRAAFDAAWRVPTVAQDASKGGVTSGMT